MNVVVPKELFPGELRVALIPAQVPQLVQAGAHVFIEQGAGEASGYIDEEYKKKGAEIVNSRKNLLAKAQVVLKVRAGAADSEHPNDLKDVPEEAVVIAMLEPYMRHESFGLFLKKKLTAFSLERVPRTTRAQAMDVLSSMASVAGYKSVLIGAMHSQKMFPMMMTAAGTIRSAEVFVIGAGVAGLQAIATAKRLGAHVRAYDIRTASKEQVESLGARFVEFDLDTGSSESNQGYAKQMSEEFYRRQRELMTAELAKSDVVITTAAVPGKKAPVLITASMVDAMTDGSVIVDLAAERGGNCELTKLNETVVAKNVRVVGPNNLASSSAYHASQMFSKNISTFFLNMIKDKQWNIDLEDDIISSCLVCRNGSVFDESLTEYFS